jgi:hypothetical protein
MINWHYNSTVEICLVLLKTKNIFTLALNNKNVNGIRLFGICWTCNENKTLKKHKIIVIEF